MVQTIDLREGLGVQEVHLSWVLAKGSDWRAHPAMGLHMTTLLYLYTSL